MTDQSKHSNHEDPGFLEFARRLLHHLQPERRDIALIVMFALILSVLALATPIAVQSLVNFVSFGGMIHTLAVLGALLFGVLALAGAIRVLQTYVVENLQQRLMVRVVAKLADRLPRVTLEDFYESNGPERVNRFFEIVVIQKIAATLLLTGTSLVLQALAGLIILAFYHPFLLALDVILVTLIAGVLFIGGRGAIRTAYHESKAKYAIAGALEETARHPLVFKLAGANVFAHRRLDELAKQYVLARKKHFAVVMRQVIGFVTLQALTATALLTLGGWLVIQGELTLGQLVAAELIVSNVLASFSKMSGKLEAVYDICVGAAKLDELLDLPLERTGGCTHEVIGQGRGLEIKGVSFGFPGHPDIISNLTFTLRPGHHLVISADDGSGKTLLAEMLLGMRTPTRGRIELDGFDLRELSLASLREKVICARDCEVIEASIEDNIRMGRSSLTASCIFAALDQVGLLQEIRALPDGISTRLSHTGSPLSVSQLRRLMVARALASQPRLLILDCILDEVDDASRERLTAALAKTDPNMAVLILTRRADTAISDQPPLVLGRSRSPIKAADAVGEFAQVQS